MLHCNFKSVNCLVNLINNKINMESTEITVKNLLKDGEFLIKDRPYSETFTPEDLNEEQKMIIDTTASFIDTEILPVYD